jgi:hypothetical protein
MMTVMMTSAIEQNPGGIRHVPDFSTIDFPCCPDGYCSTVINGEYLCPGTRLSVPAGVGGTSPEKLLAGSGGYLLLRNMQPVPGHHTGAGVPHHDPFRREIPNLPYPSRITRAGQKNITGKFSG